MSVSVYYKPVLNNGIYLMSGNSFKERLVRVFGSLPREFSREDVRELQALAALEDSSDSENPYIKLIHAIHEMDKVEVYAEY